VLKPLRAAHYRAVPEVSSARPLAR